MFGDFQFSVDEQSDDFLRKGVFSCYRPVDPDTPMPDVQRELVDEDWHALLLLAHNNKAMAFEQYSKYYLSTSGQIYWSDTHQLSTYLDDYHVRLDKQLGVKDRATEMITEIYVPRAGSAVVHGRRREGIPEQRRADRVRHRPPDRTGRLRAFSRGRSSLMPASSSICTRCIRRRDRSVRARRFAI